MSSFVWHHVAPCAGNENGVGDRNGDSAVGSGDTGERLHAPAFVNHPVFFKSVFLKHTGGPKPPPVAPVRVWRITGIGLFAVVLGIGLVGCGGKSGPTLVQLSGTILFEGRPIPPGTLTFIPKEGQGPTATGLIADAGRFTVSTHHPGDGITPGAYRIRVESWETPPTMGGPPAKSAVPAKYTNVNTTDLALNVPNEREQVVEIVLNP